ncbi:GLPGLI family protein [Litoribacter populi]|uniref:GLPGLI family protein n=1 Tax=Litoribacter populi TaxID=2598460 RepID=UPI00163DD992|nr:GLPGLI family protein [Litoribacter populi]
MKTIYTFLSALFLMGLVIAPAFGQQIKGVATYKTSSTVKLQMDSSRMNPETIAQMQAQLQKQMQKEFTLTFDNVSSSWKEVESLGGGPATAEAGGAKIMIMDGSGNALLYKNTQEGKVEQGTELMGKLFLVKDELPQYEWQLTDETKQIGHYNCQKAVYQRVADSRQFSPGMKEMEVSQDTIKVEAWYTPEIPVSHGPENYWGLPGLIMELSTGNRTMICSKIVLNPKDDVKIERPKKGKVINREDFQALQQERMQEMMNKYRGGQDGERMQIRIGG